MKRLQLFAEEAGAGEKEAAEHGAAQGLSPEEKEVSGAEDSAQDSAEDAPAGVSPEGKPAGEEKEADEGLPDTARLLLIAESVASSRLDGMARDLFGREAAETAKLYPGFDIAREMRDPAFARLVLLGAPVRSAYEAAHFDALLGAAMRYAAKKAVENAAKASPRVGENPVKERVGAVKRQSPADMTERDIRRVIEAAGRGERITFG